MVKKCVACYLVLALFVIGIAPRVDAAFAPSEVLTLSPEARTVDIEKVRGALENKLVSQRLLDLGYTSAYPTITGGIFEFGMPDALLQMWAGCCRFRESPTIRPSTSVMVLSQLSDSQLHSFAQKLDDLKVGGDGLGVIIAVLVIVVLVLVILQLTGHKVFVK